MNDFSFNMLRKPIGWVLGIGTVALIAGWAAFRNNPQGFFHYTVGNPCPTQIHSFSTVYLALVGISGALCLAIALVCLIAKELPVLGKAGANLRALARNYLIALAGFALIAVMYIPLESTFVLTPAKITATEQCRT